MELSPGKVFKSKDEMEDFFSKYQEQTQKTLNKRSCHYLDEGSDEYDRLQFHSLYYQCMCYGEYESKGKRKTNKCGCPFFVKVQLTSDRKNLVISENCNFTHNEKCNNINTSYKPTVKSKYLHI